MRSSFEWLVAWRYLRDRERPNWAVLVTGLLLLVAAGAFVALASVIPGPKQAPSLAVGALHLSQVTFYGAAGLAVVGGLVTIFGGCLAAFNLFTTISIFGVFLGVTALIVVLSVMSGFEQDLREKILGNNAHIRVKAEDDSKLSRDKLRKLLAGEAIEPEKDGKEKTGKGADEGRNGAHPRVADKDTGTGHEGGEDDEWAFVPRERPTGRGRPTGKDAGLGAVRDDEPAPAESPVERAEGVDGVEERRDEPAERLEEDLGADIEGLVAMSPYLQGEVILTGPKTHMGVYLKGVVPHLADRVSDLGRNIIEGVLDNLDHPKRLRYLYTVYEPSETIVIETGEQDLSTGFFGKSFEEITAEEVEDTDIEEIDVFSPSTEPLLEKDPSLEPPTRPRGDPSKKAEPQRGKAPVWAVEPPARPPVSGDVPLARETAPLEPSPNKGEGAPPLEASPPSADFEPPVEGDEVEAKRKPKKDLQEVLEKTRKASGLGKDDDVSALLGPEFRKDRPPMKELGDQTGFAEPRFVPAMRKVLPGIVVGKELAKTLGLHLGDTVDVVSSDAGGMGPVGPVPRIQAFRVAGVFYSGHYEFDTKYAYVRLEDAQSFLRKPGLLTGVEIRVGDARKVEDVAAVLSDRLSGQGRGLFVQTWQQIHRNLFSALKLEKIVMFLVLAIIVLVASFSIGCNLIMVVRKKRPEIATLKSMGADNPSIYRVFVIEGLYIGTIGMLLGLGVGMMLCLFLKYFGLRLDPEIYYISKLPVQIDFAEIAAICAACLGISFAATVYPAWQAAQLHPVEAFRDE